MRRVFALLTCLTGSLVGCVQLEQTLVIQPDGSGTFTMEYAVPETMLAEADPTGAFRFDEQAIREDLASYRSQGVQLESARTTIKDGWQEVRLVLTFDSLEGLTRTAFFERSSVSLRRNDQGNVVFRQTTRPSAEFGTMPFDLSDPDADRILKDRMKGFRAVLRVGVPGKILETNADQHRDRAAAWVYDFASDPLAPQRLQQAYLRVVFDGTQLSELPEFGRQHIRLPSP